MEKIIHYLKVEPRFRERKNKDRGIVNLLIEKYPRLKDIPKEILIDMVKDYNSMDRCWRKCLEENPDLRGGDYDQKTVLEQKKMISLGYIPHYQQDVKQLSLIK